MVMIPAETILAAEQEAADRAAMRRKDAERQSTEVERLRLALKSVVNHWNEFGPEHGFDEVMHYAETALRPRQINHEEKQ